MVPNSKALLLVVWAFSGGAYGQKPAYPTLWVVTNDAHDAVSIACENTSVSKPVVIAMQLKDIPARGSATHEWSKDYYNDGMGLNPGEWSCSVASKLPEKIKAHFATGWGENVKLLVSNEGSTLRLVKVKEKAPVATKNR